MPAFSFSKIILIIYVIGYAGNRQKGASKYPKSPALGWVSCRPPNGLKAAMLYDALSAIWIDFLPPMASHVKQRGGAMTPNSSDGEFPNSANTNPSRSVWKGP